MGFVIAGTLHFTHTAAYAAIVPDFLPAHRELVWASGVAEILGGVGVLIPRTRRAAGLGLVMLLVAVFPANIDMVVNREGGPGAGVPAALLWARLPLQAVLIWWVWRSTQPRRKSVFP